MRRLIKPTLWTILFLAMLLVIDQFFVQVPPLHPAHEAVSSFYRDFRGRLIDLATGEKKAQPQSVEEVIKKHQGTTKQAAAEAKKPEKPPAPQAESEPPGPSQRYIYSDGRGELHFADSLEEVPEEYRAQAQPMAK
jgi:hypothetical protein